MKKYKKGDWVLTPFNTYPVQLEQDGEFGFFDTLASENIFFKCTQEIARAVDKHLYYAVNDPREGFGSGRGWYISDEVRPAKKKDFFPMIADVKRIIEDSEKRLKYLVKIVNSLETK